MNDIHFKNHIIVHEIGKGSLVGNNASYFGCSKKNIFRFLLLKESLYLDLTSEVKFFMGTSDDVCAKSRVGAPFA